MSWKWYVTCRMLCVNWRIVNPIINLSTLDEFCGLEDSRKRSKSSWGNLPWSSLQTRCYKKKSGTLVLKRRQRTQGIRNLQKNRIFFSLFVGLDPQKTSKLGLVHFGRCLVADLFGTANFLMNAFQTRRWRRNRLSKNFIVNVAAGE